MKNIFKHFGRVIYFSHSYACDTILFSSLDLFVHPLPVDVVGGSLAALIFAVLPPPPPLAPTLPLHGLGQLKELGRVAFTQGGGGESVRQSKGEKHLCTVRLT